MARGLLKKKAPKAQAGTVLKKAAKTAGKAMISPAFASKDIYEGAKAAGQSIKKAQDKVVEKGKEFIKSDAAKKAAKVAGSMLISPTATGLGMAAKAIKNKKK